MPTPVFPAGTLSMADLAIMANTTEQTVRRLADHRVIEPVCPGIDRFSPADVPRVRAFVLDPPTDEYLRGWLAAATRIADRATERAQADARRTVARTLATAHNARLVACAMQRRRQAHEEQDRRRREEQFVASAQYVYRTPSGASPVPARAAASLLGVTGKRQVDCLNDMRWLPVAAGAPIGGAHHAGRRAYGDHYDPFAIEACELILRMTMQNTAMMQALSWALDPVRMHAGASADTPATATTATGRVDTSAVRPRPLDAALLGYRPGDRLADRNVDPRAVARLRQHIARMLGYASPAALCEHLLPPSRQTMYRDDQIRYWYEHRSVAMLDAFRSINQWSYVMQDT